MRRPTSSAIDSCRTSSRPTSAPATDPTRCGRVADLPDGKVVGLSKLARLVEGFARRPQVHERLTTPIADALMEELSPIGAACVIEATHTCMTIRGAKKHRSTMVTSALRGIFKENPSSRSEILTLMYSDTSKKL